MDVAIGPAEASALCRSLERHLVAHRATLPSADDIGSTPPQPERASAAGNLHIAL